MGLFTGDREILKLVEDLDIRVRKKFREIARDEAEEIAKTLIDEKGLDDVCRDIYEAISEAEDYIHESADMLVTNDFDNFLLATFDPYPERTEVDDYIIKEIACSEEPENFVNKTIQAYAYELWRAGIRNALKEILEERCEKAGLLRRLKAVVW